MLIGGYAIKDRLIPYDLWNFEFNSLWYLTSSPPYRSGIPNITIGYFLIQQD